MQPRQVPALDIENVIEQFCGGREAAARLQKTRPASNATIEELDGPR